MLKKFWRSFKILLIVAFGVITLNLSQVSSVERVEYVRAYTRDIEFDYVNWTIDALFVKNQTASVKPEQYLSNDEKEEIIVRYFKQLDEINRFQTEINLIYADPNIQNPDLVAAEELETLARLESENEKLGRVVEAVLQQQISLAAAELGLSLGGQLVPPLMYHVTPLPKALIVSPRESIYQEVDISLQENLSLEEIVDLENQVQDNLNVSALVVNIGGVGVYPTMVLRTTNLSWMIETIAHEWIHNYLTLRPLGMLYNATPELRTMNETTASLAGREIALVVYERFYPQFLPAEPSPTEISQPAPPPEEQAFNFRAEMHETRVTVDQLLQEDKIEEAEEYMERRRVFFWENGYRIRKINQAYFAFYGAYADVPGGAAGEDPVGPAVLALREQSGTLSAFLNRISWMTSFETLVNALEG